MKKVEHEDNATWLTYCMRLSIPWCTNKPHVFKHRGVWLVSTGMEHLRYEDEARKAVKHMNTYGRWPR